MKFQLPATTDVLVANGVKDRAVTKGQGLGISYGYYEHDPQLLS